MKKRIALTVDKEKKNYKKDFMFMLFDLELHDETLFKLCKEGLKLTAKELMHEDKIKKKYYQ